MPTIKKAKVEKYYSKIALVFIGVVVVSIITIVYFSFSKTVIIITPKPEEIKTNFTVTIGKIPEEESSILFLEGRIAEKTTTGSKTFNNLTSISAKEAKATGTVIIYNKHTSAQPLVVTTRLLSDQGVLFRIKKTITVPAGGEVEVEVEADQEGEKGNIGPTHFTIVALWKGMQEKIYGESKTDMTGGIKDVTVATLENINKAKDQLAKELKEQAIQELSREIAKENPNEKIIPQAVTYQILDEKADVEPETEVDQFKVTSKIKIIAVIFNEDKLFDLAQQKLQSTFPSDKELISADINSLQYSVKSYDLSQSTALLEVVLVSQADIKISNPIFNRDNLINRDKQEIRTYFSDFPEIENVEVKFSPFWVFRSPTLKDHIEIKIKK